MPSSKDILTQIRDKKNNFTVISFTYNVDKTIHTLVEFCPVSGATRTSTFAYNVDGTIDTVEVEYS